MATPFSVPLEIVFTFIYSSQLALRLVVGQYEIPQALS